MATVDFRIKNLKSASGLKATLAEIAGSIDATSIVQFQNVMDKLVEKGVKNLVLDCANVKYINSTGLGTLLKYVDTFESMDGHIAFTKIPSKVMLVMEMLGFNALFTIVPDEAAALRLFGGKPAEAGPALPAAPAVQPAPTISAPGRSGAGQPTIVIPPGQMPGAAPSVRKPPPPPPAKAPAARPYPASADCPRCSVTLDVGGAGKYKCPRCESLLVAEPGGKMRFYAPKGVRPLSATVPAEPALAEALGKLAEGMAEKAGFSGTAGARIGQAVASASAGVAELAYDGDESGLLHMLIIPDGKTLTIQLSDYGKAIQAEDGVPSGEHFDSAAQIMDSVELKPNPKGGNLIVLIKSAG